MIMRATTNSSSAAVTTIILLFTTTLLFSFSLQRRVCVVDGLVLLPSTLMRQTTISSSMSRGRRILNDRFPPSISATNFNYCITSSTNNMKRTAKLMHRHTSSTTLYSSSQQQGELSRPSLEREDNASTLPKLLESLWGLISHASQTMTRGVSCF